VEIRLAASRATWAATKLVVTAVGATEGECPLPDDQGSGRLLRWRCAEEIPPPIQSQGDCGSIRKAGARPASDQNESRESPASRALQPLTEASLQVPRPVDHSSYLPGEALRRPPEFSRNLFLMCHQKITFAANQTCRSPPLPVPLPARFNVEVITPKVAVLVTSVPGLLR